ncbi:hypothetical protein [Croceiramulus getboli]|nr:hypothetical protein P8624_08785 [Flavobacteriaceae bacterium YJPT1-3]
MTDQKESDQQTEFIKDKTESTDQYILQKNKITKTAVIIIVLVLILLIAGVIASGYVI